MNEAEIFSILRASVALGVKDLTNDELIALNLVATLDSDPRNRLFRYEDVAFLFDQANGTRMHSETKRALFSVVMERTGR